MNDAKTPGRSRLHYAMLTAIVMVAGCVACSELAESWPAFVRAHAGDTLWALMIFLGLGCLFPAAGTATIVSVALLVAFGIEFSQFYHAPWIDSFRDTVVGTLTIGSHFSWAACACYAVGCAVGGLAEVAGLMKHNVRPKQIIPETVVPAGRNDISTGEMA